MNLSDITYYGNERVFRQSNIHYTTSLICEKFLSHLFFFLFIAQILSPSIDQKTIYLEIIIALLNPFFILWIINQKKKLKYFLLYITIILLIVIGNPIASIKFFALSIGVLFLFYSYERNIFYLKTYIYISVFLAILQFLFIFLIPQIAYFLGPTSISETLWGEYATPTFTNFFSIFLFPRVSGLSREAGFFASLIVAYILLTIISKNRENFNEHYYSHAFLLIGYILSFSKMSFIIFPLILIEKLRRIINKIPLFITILFFVIFMIVFWSINIDFLVGPSHATFLQRFSAYPTLLNIDLNQFFFGINDPSEIKANLAQIVHYRGEKFAGFGGFILYNGILSIIVIFLGLYFAGVSSSGILILLLLTINVEIDTNQNFVVLTYFIILKYYATRKISFRN
jgi:hypothetical protein